MPMAFANGIEVRDTILWVRDTGEPDLPVILCLHSLFLDGSMFDALVSAVAGRFRIIRPDFRGQGSSAPATERSVSMECCAEDMNALIDVLGVVQVSLIGASMGGDVAIRMLASRPELFSSLVLMGSSARGEPDEQKAHFTDLLDRTATTGFLGDDLALMMSIMFGATTRGKPEAQAMLAHWEARIGQLPSSVWPAMYGVVERQSVVSLLPRVTAPTLVYSSEDDIARPIEWSEEVANGISGATLIPLPGVGHSPILEAPKIVIPQTLNFIAQAAG
jgi:3-oxoadipate enol-lactonase